MTDKIQKARRDAFESAVARDWDEHLAHFDRDGDGYVFGDIQSAWWAFSAALDAVEIELPDLCRQVTIDDESIDIYWPDEVRAAIESTNLGIKVK